MTLKPITIFDPRSGARAKILPAIGFNCYSFEVQAEYGPIEVLWSADDFLTGQGKPSHSGIPLLFPFGGRIPSFRYEGKSYSLDAGDGQGNAIHGFVLTRPWRVTEHSDHRVGATFQASIDDQALLSLWPADFRIRHSTRCREMRSSATTTSRIPIKSHFRSGLPRIRISACPWGAKARTIAALPCRWDAVGSWTDFCRPVAR
jgi:D-hexose-6-phosphate mutarotase